MGNLKRELIKITEIENRPISEAEKAAAIEKVMEVAAEEGTEPGLAEEAEKFREIHAEKAKQQEEAERAEREEYYLELMGLETRKKAEAKKVLEVGKRLGKTIEFDENITSNGKHFEDGRIVINPKSDNPLMQVLVHELTHDIETSGLYGNFSKKILDYVKNVQGIDIERMKQDIYEDYAKAGEILTPELQQRELVAKFAEQHLFTDEKAIERLCNTDPTLFQRIKYWISDMLVKLKGTAEEKFLREAERLYEKAWATRGETAGAGVEQASIINIPGKGQGVYLDTDLYNGLSDDERKEMLKARVKELGGQTLTAFDKNGNAVDFKIVTDKRFINSKGKTVRANNDLATKFSGNKVKQEAVDLIDELVLTSTQGKPVPAKHPHGWIDNNGQNNWEKWTTNIVDKNNTVWEAKLNIATSANVEKLLYDIDPIKMAGQAGTSATSSPIPTLPQTKPVVNNQGGNSPSLGRGFDELAASQSSTGQVNPDEEADRFYRELMGFEDSVPSFVHADIDRVVNDPSIDSEQKILDLMKLFDEAKSPAEKSEIGRYIYNLRTNPKEASRTVINEGEAERVSAEVAASAKRVAERVLQRRKDKQKASTIYIKSRIADGDVNAK